MTSEEDFCSRVDEVFHKAAELPPKEQERFLDQECVRDPPEIREEVLSLLRARATNLPIRCAPLPIVDEFAASQPPDPMVGQHIGDYLLRRRLGEGASGIVYLAERVDDYQRKVAIKLIRPGLAADDKALQRLQL